MSSSTSRAEEDGARYRTVEEFVDDKGYELVQDEETGFIKPVSTKKNHWFQNKVENLRKENSDFNKQFSKKYADTKRWDGQDKKKGFFPWSKSKKEFQHSPHFIKENSELANKVSKENRKTYSTSNYEKFSARETTVKGMENLPNYVIQKRREDFIQPPIISNQDYSETGRSVEDVKQLLNE